ncbi:MAG: NAD(P)-dependent oxidoreductase, partial [Bacteroidota bacterium]
LHTATLHKPHVITHSHQDFVDTNITGTLHLLEAACAAGVKAFIFTSTTSTFGDAMQPAANQGAVWVTEQLRPIPKNIYGATKTAAEDLCQLFYRNRGLPCLVLRTSRFFAEMDDRKAMRLAYGDSNLKANEYLHRRVDIEDIVDAHLLAMEKATAIGFQRYIISATTPFTPDDLYALRQNAIEVVHQRFPKFKQRYAQKGWKMFPSIERVYVNELARTELQWQPRYDFQHILDCLDQDRDYRSPLAIQIGSKGYHPESFEDGPYPI